ncbi:MAG TPA: hypothetical protein VM821_04880, partial [Abditibacteriaceae bacterium]|nr:hypothetical protein [Abditibacteriaceae bacterium]
EHIDSAEVNPSPLEKVQQHQKEMQQSLGQKSDNVEEHPPNNQSEVPGQGIPSDRRHHPQRTQY